MAEISVIPVGMLRQYVGGKERLALAGWAGRSISELLETLGIPSALVGVVLIGGQLVDKGHLLQDGEEIKLIALVGGG